MKKILITGGPVHAKLDPVKIITNNFKGGRIRTLASEILNEYQKINEPVEIFYLRSKQALASAPFDRKGLQHPEYKITDLLHDGYDNYRDLLLALAPEMDAIILGAAVANLIPEQPWDKKFPSHKYTEGETIHIPFVIAPRIINKVQNFVTSKCHLFGFKLLKDVPHEELIDAAYEIVTDSRATAVFANQRDDLDTKYVVTKEKTELKIDVSEQAKFIVDTIQDKYYSTRIVKTESDVNLNDAIASFNFLMKDNKHKFKKVNGYLFGSISVRTEQGFLTTARGKTEDNLTSYVHVKDVDHENRVISSVDKKASLNAPLLDMLFKRFPTRKVIIHTHEQPSDETSEIAVLPYAHPGTVRDSNRACGKDFFILGHGRYTVV